ncbi:queuosine precursor transporter [Pontivivens ytuae]|uniref:Probable queuosine precursor transporter n=1 Tax=Pontivivens ytuae TaxID=2789856 RepID=A0A7S9LV91_9RHOB|nr:queuosine precursor transporter [Pontivivens ytuae]QPH55917.1 queuosine precursor transporter [Pontivivens ytuae]
MSRGFLIGVAAMAAVVVASNILVQHLFGDWLTWGAFTYPIAFLVTDLTNRFLGRDAARRVVVAGFAVGVLCSLIASQIHGEYGPLTTLRIAMGSGIAFLVAQLVDVVIFDRLRAGRWWRAPLASTLVGSSLDTALFFFIAFSGALTFLDPAEPNGWAREIVPLLGMGPELPLWVSLAVADFGVKLALAAVALIPFGFAVRHRTA